MNSIFFDKFIEENKFMTKIRKSFLSVYPLLLLFILPGLKRWIIIATRSYNYDKLNLNVEEGVFNKDSMSIPLIKIESIQVRSNLLGNGTLTINAKVATKNAVNMFNLEYVRNARRVKRELNNAIEVARAAQGVKTLDTF
jgi:uncharacterized membrane protein YdbT with pleckstrin-like domain